jgi:flagellar motor switch protein FliM
MTMPSEAEAQQEEGELPPSTMPQEETASAGEVPPSGGEAELSDEAIAALMGGGSPTEELSDDEIAKLLAGEASQPQANLGMSVEQLIADSVVSQSSPPMLAHIGDRLRGRLTISLRNHTSENVEITDFVELLRYGDYINRVPLPVMIGIAEAREWSLPLMVVLDGALIQGLVEILMGGRKTVSTKPDQRSFTAIEQRMIERTIQIVLDDLGTAFGSLTEVSFALNQIEMNPRFAGIARDSDIVLLVRFKIQIERRSGLIDIVLPRATLDPVREQMAQRFVGERGRIDATWEERLRAQLSTSEVEIVARLSAGKRCLGEVLSWRPGTHISLEATPETDVEVLYGGMPAWRALMGRKQGRVALCLDQKIMGSE